MLHPRPNVMQDVLGALACLEAIAAIGLVVVWGRQTDARSESPLRALCLEFGRGVASRLRFVGTRVQAVRSHRQKLGNAAWQTGSAGNTGAPNRLTQIRDPSGGVGAKLSMSLNKEEGASTLRLRQGLQWAIRSMHCGAPRK
jgi:hypothetical protein